MKSQLVCAQASPLIQENLHCNHQQDTLNVQALLCSYPGQREEREEEGRVRQRRREGKKQERERGRKEEGERERIQKALYCAIFQLLCLKPVQHHGQSLTNLIYNFQIAVE